MTTPVIGDDGRPYIQGSGGCERNVIGSYAKDPECLKAYHPMTFRSHPPQFESLKVTIPSEYKISGTEFLQPMSAIYKDFAH